MTRYALLAALCASLAAAGMFWLWQRERDARRDAEATVAAQDRVIAVLNDYAGAVVNIETSLRDSLEVLNGVPDTQGCGPSVGAALERLRQSAR